MTEIERRQGDEMIRLSLMDGQARVMMCETTAMCQRRRTFTAPPRSAPQRWAG